MKMKMKKYILLIICLAISYLPSCNDDFMDRYPQTEMTEEGFFTSVKDLQTYTNKLYDQFDVSLTDIFSDVYSDNISLYTGTSETDILLRGTLTPNSVGGWTKDIWGELRSINIFMKNAVSLEVSGTDEKLKNHFVGLARFFRANFYINMIQRYGQAPWYDTPILTTDEELLTRPNDTREFIVSKIMEDLKYATENMLDESDSNASTILKSRTAVSKYAAYSMLSRFALYEGTYRKYHKELGLESTANEFLKEAENAAKAIMDSGQFQITGSGREGYKALFSSSSLTNNKEMILFIAYEKGLRTQNASSVFNWQWQLSGDLAESYLMLDGTPFTNDPANLKKEFKDIFTDRDPRMAETIMPPGYILANSTNPGQPSISFGLLAQIKFLPATMEDWGGYGANTNDIPFYRYAETLLNYAEAKAELGTLTASDLQVSVDLLRARVGMPPFSMTVGIDPVLEAQYPNVSGSQKALILEIRRERRVELACEGLRFQDINRWAVGELLAKNFKGVYIPALGAYDITGDNIPDIAVLKDEKSTGPIDNLPSDVKEKLVINYLIKDDGSQGDIYLSEGDHGYVMFTRDVSIPKSFIAPKYYYRPIPYTQMRDNPNLTQPEGWE